jgi:glyoxylase-like metal-dependent hydrolase (beta-lactamase superfamily II)
LGVEAVKAILVTHGHGDHIGGCKQFPGAQVYVGEGDLGLVDGTKAANGPLPKLMGPMTKLALTGAHGLTDGQSLELGTLKVRAFILPGHTAGSTAYLVGGSLFMGDSLGINSDGSVRKAPWIFSDDSAVNVASLLKLGKTLAPEAADIKAIVPAHSGSAEGFKALADYAGG